MTESQSYDISENALDINNISNTLIQSINSDLHNTDYAYKLEGYIQRIAVVGNEFVNDLSENSLPLMEDLQRIEIYTRIYNVNDIAYDFTTNVTKENVHNLIINDKIYQPEPEPEPEAEPEPEPEPEFVIDDFCNNIQQPITVTRTWDRYDNTLDANIETFIKYGEKLDERRKAEILQYKSNATKTSRTLNFVRSAKGNTASKKKAYASQTSLTSNSNVNQLELSGNVLLLGCPPSDNNCNKTNNICFDSDVPLVNYKNRRQYND